MHSVPYRWLTILPAMLVLAAVTPNAAAQTPATAPNAAPPAAPNAAQPSPLTVRIGDIAALLQRQVTPQDIFNTQFLSAVSPSQIDALTAQLVAAWGTPTIVRDVVRNSATSARFTLVLERAAVPVQIQVDGDGRIAALYFGPPLPLGDTLALLSAEFAALPGQVSWGLYRLDPTAPPALLAGSAQDQSLAIGSAFKLAILGAIDADIRNGRMRWSDVVRIDRHSVPSGMTQNWPINAPATLHTLATLMISISDNTATDTLLRHVGRARVEAFVRNHGGLSGPMAFPTLSTFEATVLKNPANSVLRNAWLSAPDAAARRLLLDGDQTALRTASVDISIFGDTPRDIATTEWFASADAVAQLLNWFATDASDDARAILAINPGIGNSAASRWAYIGFKGGSEPGVISMNLLLRTTSGQNYAIAAHWNNPAAPVDDAAFAALVNRLAALAQSAP